MFFFFKQKTAYEMRISDWSPDVCSSDLALARPLGRGGLQVVDRAAAGAGAPPREPGDDDLLRALHEDHRLDAPVDVRQEAIQRGGLGLVAREIGRASGRERGCQYV